MRKLMGRRPSDAAADALDDGRPGCAFWRILDREVGQREEAHDAAAAQWRQNMRSGDRAARLLVRQRLEHADDVQRVAPIGELDP